MTRTEAEKASYSKTYWCHKGKHEDLSEKLNALVPDSGEVANADDNPALEKFRKALNCYYDLYNNGLCNLAEEFEHIFGIRLPRGEDEFEDEIPDHVALTQELVNKTEAAMNRIIRAAAKEQRL